MPHEFYDCMHIGCYVSDVLVKKPYHDFWPQLLIDEKDNGYAVWSFYIRWRGKQGTHVNKVRVCALHHQEILSLAQDDMALDVQEQEATERWLIKTSNQMF